MRYLDRRHTQANASVLKATVNVTEQKAAIQYVPGMVSLHTLRQVVELTGDETYDFAASGSQEDDPERAARMKEYNGLRNRLIFGAVLAGIVMLLTFGEFIPVFKAIPLKWTGSSCSC